MGNDRGGDRTHDLRIKRTAAGDNALRFSEYFGRASEALGDSRNAETRPNRGVAGDKTGARYGYGGGVCCGAFAVGVCLCLRGAA